MISDIFSKTKLSRVDNELKYTDEFLKVLIINEFFREPIVPINKVERLIKDNYNSSIIKYGVIRRFCELNFSMFNDDAISIDKEDIEIFERIYEIDRKVLEDDSVNGLYKEIYEINNDDSTDIDYCMEVITKLHCNEGTIKKEALYYRYYWLLKRYSLETEKINKFKNEKMEFFGNNPISKVTEDEIQKNIFLIRNMELLEDLKKLPTKLLLIMYLPYLDEFLNKMKIYTKNQEEVESSILNIFEVSLTDMHKNILLKRFHIENPLTLQEISNEYGLTRERIRQIEGKILNKLRLMPLVKEYIDTIYFLTDAIKWVDTEIFLSKIDNVALRPYIYAYIAGLDASICCDPKLKIIYDARLYSKSDILTQYKGNLKDFIRVDEFDELDSIEKYIVSKRYSLYKDLVYMKSGLYSSDIFAEVVKENFPNGFRISDETDFNIFKERVTLKYGHIADDLTMHNLLTMITRKDFVLKDVGEYIPTEFAAIIPKYLLDRIIDFIEVDCAENKIEVIYYTMLYSKFENELKQYGVNNKYYLKGLIDKHLPKEFLTKRDYIYLEDTITTSTDAISKVLQSFEGYFSLDDIKEKIPGLYDYNYNAYVSREQKNGLLYADVSTYVNIKYKNITDEIIRKIEECIEYLFGSLNTTVLSSKKVYSRLKIFESEVIETLDLLNGHIELFSIIQYIFKDKYYFSRPFIGKDENFADTFDEILADYVSNLDEFDSEVIQNYISKMNLRSIQSYIFFMENLSQEFVQVDMDKMVRKEKLNIKEYELGQIKKMISLVLNNIDQIDTRTFKTYSIFPQLSVKWNKYLLVGIIRTYFDKEFQIENTEKAYNMTDFIIRRI